VILLQPRRVAARAIARRIAHEQQWVIGREVGWQIRFERRSSTETRLLVVTEGILTARLQHDPLLSDFVTIVFDEFHERSIHSDLGLALARHAWRARDEMHIVVMSATLAVDRVSAFFGDCPVLEVPGQPYPTEIEHAPEQSVPAAVAQVLPRSRGQVLCFLPGVAEIERAREELLGTRVTAEVLALHGSIDGETQDRVLQAVPQRRVILATNIAETSLTVPGVSTVVDTGYHKVARYDAARAIDSLTLERIPQDAADQRAGRASRLGPGLVRRLWDPRLRLPPHREPDIARLDLAGPVLYLIAWGEHPSRFEWFEAPPPHRIDGALRLLRLLGAIDSRDRLTPTGERVLRVPTHPRLARILLEARGAPAAVAACAHLSGDAAFADPLRRVIADAMGAPFAQDITDEGLRHALFCGYADRLAKRRPEARQRVVLASGHGAVVLPDAEPIPGDYLVALEMIAGARDGIAEARIRSGSAVEREWIHPTASEVVHRLDQTSGRVRAARVTRYEAIVLDELPVAPDPDRKAHLLADAWLARTPDEEVIQLTRRARFAGRPLDLEALAIEAAHTADAVDDVDIAPHLPYDLRQALEREAPASLALPSGRRARLQYREDGVVSAAVKLQELFGLADSPRIGPRKVPVLFELLAPNGRAVQTTHDLRSFWDRTYPEVRKELRGRYPKHPWPDDPWSATPTHRAKRSKPPTA
jgi:ATP-dependent helicase HrpB